MTHLTQEIIFDPITGSNQSISWRPEGSLRENGSTTSPVSTSRIRALAATVVASFSLHGAPLHTIAELASSKPNLYIWNTETSSSLHHQLSKLPNYVASEFFSSARHSGEMMAHNGQMVRHEDMQNTSFPDNSLDLILSTEVLEHVPFPYMAHKELFRILKPGGVHIFSAPFAENTEDDIVKAILDPTGTINYIGEPQYHGDPLRAGGVLVYNIFGRSMMSKLCEIGYRVSVYEVLSKPMGIRGMGLINFIATKPLRSGKLSKQ